MSTASSTPGKAEPADSRAALEQIVDEHRALADSVGRLERTTDPHQLLPRLEKLKRQLEHHFEGEEATDGVRDDVTRNAPYLLSSLQAIFDEHREFLDQIEQLEAKTRACLAGPLAEILEGVVTLTRNLRDHEARESELLSDVYYTDYGTGAD